MIYIEIYLVCLIVINFLMWSASKRNNTTFTWKKILLCNTFSPLVLSAFILNAIIPKKRYQTFFKKDDTPFGKEFQQNKKYHVVWKRMAYEEFLGHKVIKVKLFGIFTLFNREEKS